MFSQYAEKADEEIFVRVRRKLSSGGCKGARQQLRGGSGKARVEKKSGSGRKYPHLRGGVLARFHFGERENSGGLTWKI